MKFRDAEGRKMPKFKLALFPGAAMLAVLFLSSCTQRHQNDPRTETQLVRLARVEPSSGSDPSFTGTVTARIQSNLGFRVPGKITERLVDDGQIVRAGQPLMRIDRTDYAHAITAQTESVAAERARAEQTAADEARYRGLVATGAVSASTYDQIKAAADSAQAQLAAAEAQEKIARDQGDYSILVADSDGTVVETLAEPGQVVAAGQTVVKLAHAGPREATVYLPETVRPALGTFAKATLFGQTGETPARLRQLSDSADRDTRTFEARYVLQGRDANAPLGATVTIELPLPKTSQLIAVPSAAITDRGKGPGVWVFNEKSSTVSFRRVQILQLDEEYGIVSSGVRPGEQIVALAAHLLSEGQSVRIEDHTTAMQ